VFYSTWKPTLFDKKRKKQSRVVARDSAYPRKFHNFAGSEISEELGDNRSIYNLIVGLGYGQTPFQTGQEKQYKSIISIRRSFFKANSRKPTEHMKKETKCL
jgi:hypothetical protein